MAPVSDLVRRFFIDFEKAINTPDPELLASRYGSDFMFANVQGVQAIQKDGFLKVLPRRSGLFRSIGLTATTLGEMEETRLDDPYVMVKVYWQFHFEKEGRKPIIDENPATYILFQQGDQLSIVFQYDHQDLMARAKTLGLLPG